MRVLIIGGTGLISVGIVTHLLARGADVTVLNRGKHPSSLPAKVKTIVGDRDDRAGLAKVLAEQNFDCIIDMVCFKPEQATAVIEAATGHCGHFIFCSTVCTYGAKTPPGIFIDETFLQEPVSDYGRNKLACEKLFLKADEEKKLVTTIVRPSNTYGPGNAMIDNLEFEAVAWDRIERGQPVLCAGDGLGLWVSTHRDDCAKFFAYAVMNPVTFGQCYNTTRKTHLTWRDFYREGARSLGKPVQLIFMPASWIVAHEPQRFTMLREITSFHGAYDSSKAMRDVPEFTCEIELADGAAEVFADLKRRGAWKQSAGDNLYQSMVDQALEFGAQPFEL